MHSPPSPDLSPLSRTALLRLSEAIEHTFDATDWTALGEALGLQDLQDPASRLREAHHARDDEYGAYVVQVVRHLESAHPQQLRTLARRPALQRWLAEHHPADRALFDPAPAAQEVAHPATAPGTQAVAVQIAEHALAAAVQARSVAQLHAALHGYLADACARAGLPSTPAAGLATLLGMLRVVDPGLQALAARDPVLFGVLQSLASAADAMHLAPLPSAAQRPETGRPALHRGAVMADICQSLFSALRTA